MEGEFPDRMKCPVCLGIPQREIFQCKNGHTVCFSCSQNLTTCPQCRVAFETTKIRNRALEELLDMLKFDCEHKQKGCAAKLSRKEISKHLTDCLFGGECIPFCDYLGFTCGFSINTRALPLAILHFEQHHNFIFRRQANLDIRLENFESCISAGNSFWTPVVVELSKQLFIILCMVNLEDLSLTIFSLDVSESGLDNSCLKHRIEFAIQPLKSEENPEISWTTKLLQGKHFPSAVKTPFFRIPLNLLLMQYVRENSLVIQCSIQNPVQGMSSSPRSAEQVSAIPFSNASLHDPLSNTQPTNSRAFIKAQRRQKPFCWSSWQESLMPKTKYVCSQCKVVRFAREYICLECPEYNICNSCHDTGKHKHHIFCLVETPEQKIVLDSFRQRLHNTNFLGTRENLFDFITEPELTTTINRNHLLCSKCSNMKKYVCLICKNLAGYCNDCFRNMDHSNDHVFALTDTRRKLNTVLQNVLESNFDTLRVLTNLLSKSATLN